MKSVNTLLDDQAQLEGLISRAVANLKKVGTVNINRVRVQGRLNALVTNWQKYQANHQELLSYRADASAELRSQFKELDYFKNQEYLACEETFLDNQEAMTSILETLQAANPPDGAALDNTSSQSHGDGGHRPHRLPQLQLPKFGGDYHEWATFKDLFTSLVGSSTDLSSVEKLQYLKLSLTGIAADRLKTIAVTKDNFQRAWDSLVSHYENKRILVDTHLQTLFSAPKVNKESSAELDKLSSRINQALLALEALNRPVDQWDDLLVFLTVRKLDPESIRAWEAEIGANTTPPTWLELETFLTKRVRSIQAFERATQSVRPKPRNDTPGAKSHHASTKPPISCACCSAKHFIISCPEFRTRSVEQRLACIAQKRLCFNCLGPHLFKDCTSQKRCQRCERPHHTLIHGGSIGESTFTSNQGIDEPQSQAKHAQINNEGESSVNVTAVSCNAAQIDCSNRASVLLATALVKVTNRDGDLLEARALLDQGSEISLVTESLVQRLHLPRSRSAIPIVGIGSDSPRASRGSVALTIASRVSAASLKVSASILPRLTGDLPSHSISDHKWAQLNSLTLADPRFHLPGKVDLLLGADVYGQLLLDGLIKGSDMTPTAQNTHLGWILSGRVAPSSSRPTNTPQRSFQCSLDRELVTLFKQFVLQEEAFSSPADEMTLGERQCLQHYTDTHSRAQNGQYIVRLPFKRAVEDFGDSRTPATKMFLSQERRMSHDLERRAAYNQFLQEYEDLGHMRRVSALDNTRRAFYLPHHGVTRESSSSTKLRVVFNGSQTSNTGLSLNDCLHEGPRLLANLADVISQWRIYEFAFSADIAKMYRQILVHQDDWDYQRIIWRKDADTPLHEYALVTVTYGTRPAPFLALATLQQLQQDEGHRFPLARDVIKEGSYVDDIFSGAHTMAEGIEKVHQVNELLKAGGFPLKKWKANCNELLHSIPEADRESAPTFSFEGDPLYRTLGLAWNQHQDAFTFDLSKQNEPPLITKRFVLSRTAQMFDPLGWIAPVIVQAKILLQEVWSAKLEWDEPLPQHLLVQWQEYSSQLIDISRVSVPRWLGLSPSASGVEIHGFSDASKAALGAVVYVRVLQDYDDARVTIVTAKSKVAPLSKSPNAACTAKGTRITIPRLELSAAALLAQLVKQVCQVLKLESTPIHLWTDSTITYYWVRGQASRWKDFVRNRVTLIQETVPTAHWHHLAGENNPADIASRGMPPHQLAQNQLWWHGPAWLKRHSTSWPSSQPPLNSDADLEERPSTTATVTKTIDLPFDLTNQFSSLTRLIRVTAWCLRYMNTLRLRIQGKPVVAADRILTPTELNEATLHWVKVTQMNYFTAEIKSLSKKLPLSKANPLCRLTPFIDALGILRVGGRLKNSQLSQDAMHPIILPRNSSLTTLILDSAHRRTLHGGTQVMLATLRCSYWIIGGRAPVRGHVLRCVVCARHRAVAAQQLMGQLPASRTTASRPFLHTGVDYAGPFTLKTWRGRGAKTYKAYLVVFVCFSTSAVHLELTTDYSTEGFLAAFTRFTNRRGICTNLYSDCGTNLVGADAELKRLFTASSTEFQHLANLLANDGTKWSFNPPAAPHFGGKWEAAVKSSKFHIKRIVGDTRLTYEDFSTFLTQVEAVLNSRPLCPLSDDPDDIEALTPGHFLIGGPINAIPVPSLIKLPDSRLSRWQLLRKLMEQFWERWSKEYLQQLQATSKWHTANHQPTVGSIVLIIDERYPPTKWPLARILELHTGRDGLARVATLKTQTSTLTRPLVKLCILPTSSTPEATSN